MNDLGTLANLAEILGSLTIVGGAIFGVIQIREFREQRRQMITVELVRSFYSPSFTAAMNLVRRLPDGVSVEELRRHGAEYEEAAFVVTTTFESVAFLVFREMTSFSLVRELSGGICSVMYRKLSAWIEGVRADHGQPSFAEWYQWLAEQLARESAAKEANPAYKLYADWRPRKY